MNIFQKKLFFIILFFGLFSSVGYSAASISAHIHSVDSLWKKNEFKLIYRHVRDHFSVQEVLKYPKLVVPFIAAAEIVQENEVAIRVANLFLANPRINHKDEASVQITMARLYEKIGNGESCYSFLWKARSAISQSNSDTLLPVWSSRISSYHRIFGDKDSARFYAMEGIRIADKEKTFAEKAVCQFLLAFLSTDREEREELFRISLNTWLLTDDYHGASHIYCALYKNQPLSIQVESSIFLDSARYFAGLHDYDDPYSVVFWEYSEHYRKQGEFQLALNYRDSFEMVSKEAEAEMNALHIYGLDRDFEELELSNKINIKDVELKEQQKIILLARKGRRQWIVISVILVLCLLLGWRLYTRQRFFSKEEKAHNKIIKEKNNALEDALHTNKMLLHEMAHRVKNSLQTVSSLLSMQARYEDESLNRPLINAQTRIQAFSIAHQSLYLNNQLEKIEIRAQIESIVKNVLNEKIDWVLEVDEITLSFEKGQGLLLIINELLMNSLKHAWPLEQVKCEIKLMLTQSETSYTLIYEDNGVGMQQLPNDSKSSMGYFIIRAFLNKSLKGNMKLNSEKSEGFKLIITFDL